MPKLPSIICFDLDGTVYKPGWHHMTRRVTRAFDAAHEAGIPTCVVSGRPWPMINPALRHAKWLDWCITVNGATIWKRSPKELIATNTIDLALAKDLVDALANLGPSWFLFSNAGERFEATGASYLFGRWERIVGKVLRHTPPWLTSPFTMPKGFLVTRSVRGELERMSEGPTKLNCNFPSGENLEEGIRRMKELAPLEIVRMWYGELEITAPGVTKGTGFDRLCEHAGFDASRAVMFGDSANDLPMAGHVGKFVAVANASDEVKAVANEICPRVEDDGVAVWLENALRA